MMKSDLASRNSLLPFPSFFWPVFWGSGIVIEVELGVHVVNRLLAGISVRDSVLAAAVEDSGFMIPCSCLDVFSFV